MQCKTGEEAADDAAHAVHAEGVERVVVPGMVLRLLDNGQIMVK